MDFPLTVPHGIAPLRYLKIFGRAVEAADIPIVASLNGITDHGWINYAQEIEQAGADALEPIFTSFPLRSIFPGTRSSSATYPS